ncbi:hypothetical protein [Limnobacter sp.]
MNSLKKHFGGPRELFYLLKLYHNKRKSRKTIDQHTAQLFDLTHIQFRAWTAYILNRTLASKNAAIGLTANEQLIWNDKKNNIRAITRLISPLRFLINLFFEKIIHIDKQTITLKSTSDISKFTSKWDLLSYESEGVKIGDLIYDTYLKHFKKPTVDINDKKLYDLVKEATAIQCIFSTLLAKNNIKVIYVTHSAYIFYGVLVRSALKKGIKVYIFGNSRTGDSRELHLEDWYQLPRIENRLKYFESLDSSHKTKYIEMAKEILKNRFSGKIDQLISYMKVQPYSSSSTIDYITSKEKLLILYLHDFFDSPHVYGDMLFPDFYEWILFISDWSKENGVRLLLKKHPNAMCGNDEVLAAIVADRHHIEIINQGDAISLTRQFPNALFLSVYGTCTQEIAYNSGKILLAGANPYMKSTMAITASSIDDYKSYLHSWINNSLTINMDSFEPFYTIAAYFLAEDNKMFPGTMNNTDLCDIKIQ